MERFSRRSFLGWLPAGAAAILLPSILRPKPKVFDLGRSSFLLPDELVFGDGSTIKVYSPDGRLLGLLPIVCRSGEFKSTGMAKAPGNPYYFRVYNRHGMPLASGPAGVGRGDIQFTSSIFYCHTITIIGTLEFPCYLRDVNLADVTV